MTELNDKNNITILVVVAMPTKFLVNPFKYFPCIHKHIFQKLKSMYESIFVYVDIHYVYFSLFGVIIVHSAFNLVMSPFKLDFKSLYKSKEGFPGG